MKRLAAVILLFACAAVAQTGGDPNQAQIEGTVASAANGQLLARARVFLRSVAQKDRYVVRTDADDYGHFVFGSVDPGSYEVVAEKQGFFSDPHKTPSQEVEVKAGDHIQGMALRLIPLAAVTGRIVNEHDDPVQDAQVRLLSREYLRGRELLNPAAFATTDDRGEYRIFGVRPGNYYLVVEYDVKKAHKDKDPFPGIPVRNATPEVTYPPLFYPLTSDLRQAQRIFVAAGAELHFDFAFLSTPSVSVEGKVVDGVSGAPIKNPSIVAYWGDRITGITRKVDLTGPPGEFKLDGIEPGPYTLVASYSRDGETYSDFQVLDVGVAGLKDVVLALMPPFTLAGQVRFENAEVESRADPLPNSVSVEFMPLEENIGAFRVTAVADPRPGESAKKARLAFTTRLNPGRRYRVAIPNLPQDYYVKSILMDGHEAQAGDVIIHGNNSEMILVASPGGGHIAGVVRNSQGKPISGHVLLAPDIERLTPEQVRSVRADQQGKFTLRGITPGNYKLYAWEDVDLNEMLGQLDLLKNFEAECQSMRVDENGAYTPELRAIAVR